MHCIWNVVYESNKFDLSTRIMELICGMENLQWYKSCERGKWQANFESICRQERDQTRIVLDVIWCETCVVMHTESLVFGCVRANLDCWILIHVLSRNVHPIQFLWSVFSLLFVRWCMWLILPDFICLCFLLYLSRCWTMTNRFCQIWMRRRSVMQTTVSLMQAAYHQRWSCLWMIPFWCNLTSGIGVVILEYVEFNCVKSSSEWLSSITISVHARYAQPRGNECVS